jgi:hypothetical protein
MDLKELLSREMTLDLLKDTAKGRGKKETFPTKRHMNLYHQPEKSTRRATAALYVLFAVVVAVALGKFLFFDLWSQVHTLEETQASAQQQLAECEAQLTDYDDVALRYSLYSATPEEEAQTDRMDVLALLDAAVRPTANIESVSVGGGQVLVQFSGVSLRQTAQIVQQLEGSDLVAGTNVDTAFTTQDGASVVKANLLLDLAKEASQADDTTEGSVAP